MTKALERNGALSKLRDNGLVEILGRVARHDAEIVEAANRADEIDTVEDGMALLKGPPEAIADAGFTKKQLRAAIDAKKGSKEVPFYLKMANDRALMRWRDGSGEKASPKPSMVVLPITVHAPAAPGATARVVIDGKEVGK